MAVLAAFHTEDPNKRIAKASPLLGSRGKAPGLTCFTQKLASPMMPSTTSKSPTIFLPIRSRNVSDAPPPIEP
jgi:hypothetical protein